MALCVISAPDALCINVDNLTCPFARPKSQQFRNDIIVQGFCFVNDFYKNLTLAIPTNFSTSDGVTSLLSTDTCSTLLYIKVATISSEGSSKI